MLALNDLALRFLLWDWDGPLHDTFESGIDLVEILARQRGYAFTGSTRDTLRVKWGKPGFILLSETFDICPEEGRVFYREWCDLEMQELLKPGLSSKLHPGAAETLQDMVERGKRHGLVTSRPDFAIEQVMRTLNARRYFAHVAPQGSCEFHKPDPGAFNPSMTRFCKGGITEHNCIWIGDTPADIQAGTARGLITFAVRTGPFQYYEPEGIDPDFVIDSVADLIPRMRDLGWRS